MFWFGLILILVGIINIICAKKRMYWDFNDYLQIKLFGESFTRVTYFISGIMLIIFGIFILTSFFWS